MNNKNTKKCICVILDEIRNAEEKEKEYVKFRLAEPKMCYVDKKHEKYVVVFTNGVKTTATYKNGYDKYLCFCQCITKYYLGGSNLSRDVMELLEKVNKKEKENE